jgi:hypothetical protein
LALWSARKKSLYLIGEQYLHSGGTAWDRDILRIQAAFLKNILVIRRPQDCLYRRAEAAAGGAKLFRRVKAQGNLKSE